MGAAITSAFDRVSISQARGPRLAKLALAALGVVYGDIGTSPLYAVRECFGEHGVAVNDANVLGVMSLIVWSSSALEYSAPAAPGAQYSS